MNSSIIRNLRAIIFQFFFVVGPMNATVAPIFCKTGLMLVTAVFSAIILRATFGC